MSNQIDTTVQFGRQTTEIDLGVIGEDHVLGKLERERERERDRDVHFAWDLTTYLSCRGQDWSGCSRRVRAHEKFLSVQVI